MKTSSSLRSGQSSELIQATASILVFIGRIGLYVRHRAGHVKSPDGDVCVALGDCLHNFERLGQMIVEADIEGSMNELALLGCAIANNQALTDIRLNEVGLQSIAELRNAMEKELLAVKGPIPPTRSSAKSDALNAANTH